MFGSVLIDLFILIYILQWCCFWLWTFQPVDDTIYNVIDSLIYTPVCRRPNKNTRVRRSDIMIELVHQPRIHDSNDEKRMVCVWTDDSHNNNNNKTQTNRTKQNPYYTVVLLLPEVLTL